MKTYNIEESTKGQKEYCENHELPHFAPSDGICWSCHRQIYDEDRISVEEAKSELITGCPVCHRSFCD